MIPTNQRANEQKGGGNQCFSDGTFNFYSCKPKTTEANNTNIHLKTWDLPVEDEKNTKDLLKDNMINLRGDSNTTPKHALYVDKEKQIVDYQMKMLEEFLSTTGRKNPQLLTPELENEFQKFFDKYEAQTKSDVATNKTVLERNMVKENAMGTPNKFEQTTEEELQQVNEDLIDELLLEKNLEKRHLSTPSNVNNLNAAKMNTNKLSYHFRIGETFKNTDIMDQIISNNKFNFPALTLNENTFHVRVLEESNDSKENLNNFLYINKTTPKSQLNSKLNELITKNNFKYLEPIKLDEKIFQKQKELKSEAEKLFLTPGPTLTEKALVLPQMMKRVFMKTVSTNKSNSDNCQQREHISKSLSESAYATSWNTQNPAPHVSLSKENQKFTVDATILRNNQYGTGNIDNFQRSSRFTTIESLKVSKQKRNQSQGLSSLEPSPRVLKAPQLLTDDCNKERFVNSATSLLFMDFINGK